MRWINKHNSKFLCVSEEILFDKIFTIGYYIAYVFLLQLGQQLLANNSNSIIFSLKKIHQKTLFDEKCFSPIAKMKTLNLLEKI